MNDQAPTMPAAAPEPSSFRLIATLGLAGLLSGLALVTIYRVTLPAIERNRAAALKRAIFKVLPGCSSFETLELSDDTLHRVEPGQETEGADRIYAGLNEAGALLGFALPGGEPGFQDIIKGIFGFDAGREVIVGFEVLESRETPGLGDKIYKDDAFLANFTALAVDPALEPVPPGKKTSANQVETITGATISSKAVVRLLQKGLDRWRPHIKAYVASRKGAQQ